MKTSRDFGAFVILLFDSLSGLLVQSVTWVTWNSDDYRNVGTNEAKYTNGAQTDAARDNGAILTLMVFIRLLLLLSEKQIQKWVREKYKYDKSTNTNNPSALMVVALMLPQIIVSFSLMLWCCSRVGCLWQLMIQIFDQVKTFSYVADQWIHFLAYILEHFSFIFESTPAWPLPRWNTKFVVASHSR